MLTSSNIINRGVHCTKFFTNLIIQIISNKYKQHHQVADT